VAVIACLQAKLCVEEVDTRIKLTEHWFTVDMPARRADWLAVVQCLVLSDELR